MPKTQNIPVVGRSEIAFRFLNYYPDLMPTCGSTPDQSEPRHPSPSDKQGPVDTHHVNRSYCITPHHPAAVGWETCHQLEVDLCSHLHSLIFYMPQLPLFPTLNRGFIAVLLK